MTYITVTDADSLLPTGWEGSGDKDTAVQQANDYLAVKLKWREFDTVPDDIKRAGAMLSQEAANGRLYADRERELASKTVRASGVESTKEWREGSTAVSGTLQQVNDLLARYVAPHGASVSLLRRL